MGSIRAEYENTDLPYLDCGISIDTSHTILCVLVIHMITKTFFIIVVTPPALSVNLKTSKQGEDIAG